MSKLTVYKESGYLLNVKKLTESQIEDAKDRFTFSLYDHSACDKCEQLASRHSEICDGCAAFMGHRALAKEVERGDQVLLSLPYGAKKEVRSFLKSLGKPYVVVNRHPQDKPFSRPIKFTGQLRDYQLDAQTAILREKKGIVKAPPRSGKTVIGTATICTIGQKTIVLAAQREWLIGFQETFLGNANQEAMSNASARQIGFCKTYEDFVKTDVCLATFAQFFSPAGRNLLGRIRSLFPVLMVDEVHLASALQTSRVLAQFNAEYRIGLTGTPERKQADLVKIFFNLIGPIIYEAKIDRLRPRVELLNTECKKDINGFGQAAFTRFVTAIEKEPDRIKKICKRVIQLVNQGHMVLLPVQRVKSVDLYCKVINRMLGEDAKRIAFPFYGNMTKERRKETINRCRDYRIKVLVGNAKLISVGLNIPRASCIFERVTVSSNVPNCDQRVSRILTPMDGKPQPLIVYVLDDSKIMQTTARTEWWGCIHPRHRPLMDARDRAILMEWFKGKSQSDISDLNDV